ncbi:glycogenin-2-like [Argiope bruennichi]|uniref:glycogenin glucosyltransferase n=1 Tax=Argiope bruennichi TaxID=94029 RepID=A0A8T0FY48_ARGBR|nr:glycogenin-2-like [Argiope bruennichi]KAF8795108.1 Glycogenin-1 like protein [Argiope bruennichi]
MSQPQVPGNPDLVSKVSFFPVEDRTGENKALIVTIRKVVPEEGSEFYGRMEPPRRSLSVDSRKKTRSRTTSDKSKSRGTMTENPTSASFSTQTAAESSSSKASGTDHVMHSSAPCLKHAAENISRKASHIPTEKVSLCSNCSKSMLSYIFLVQDFLDSLAKEIIGDDDSKNCVQCLRQENRLSVTSSSQENVLKPERKTSKSREKSTDSQKLEKPSQIRDSEKISIRIEGPQDVRKYEQTAEKLIQQSISEHLEDRQRDTRGSPFQQNADSKNSEQQKTSYLSSKEGERQSQQRDETQNQLASNKYEDHDDQQDRYQTHPASNRQEVTEHQQTSKDRQYRDISEEQIPPVHQHEQMSSYRVGSQDPSWPSEPGRTFRKPMDRQQPNFAETHFYREQRDQDGSDQNGFSNVDTVSSPSIENTDTIMPILSNVDREVYDAARNGAGWESLSESQERITVSSTSRITSEAFVTMCRNNAEALGCLVVGTSLLLCRTSRTLCVVMSDGVSNAFRGPLSSVFHVVQCVRSMDSLGTTKLALLEQPDLGISFEKLNVWRLLQFNKCVYLNPDTLVIKNCDELFCHEELSAVPDIGWPDCFNSGVFVFVPSIQTFWQLLEFAEKQGSYDGGDQGLLNSYFSNWSEDISKKLSFIYNLMANVSYTYTPAYKQFGRNVKIVQFHGSFKPWHVKFFSRSGQINPATPVHPTYVQFVYIWIKIFRLSALKQLNQEIQSYALSQEVYCAVELLRFFPLPTESETEFFLTPPSVRLRLAERKLQKPSKVSEDIRRRKSAEYTPLPDSAFESPEAATEITSTADESIVKPSAETKVSSTAETKAPEAAESKPTSSGTAEKETDAVEAEDAKKIPEKNLLPGAEVGNYQGMKAWEQGRMDYQGTDSSDTIIKRLEFLMSHPK